MEKVYRGIPDAKELLRIYGKESSNSKRIYMVLQRPRNGGSNPNPQSIPTPGVSNPNPPSPSLQLNPNSNATSLRPSTNQSQPSLSPAQPNSNPPSLPPSTNQFQPSLSPARPNPNPLLLPQQSTTHPNPISSQTSVTNSVIEPESSSGATSVASGVVNQVDLTLPTSEYGVITIDDIDDSDLDRSYLASNPVNVDSACHLTGTEQWQTVGVVEEDMSSLGVFNLNAQVPLNDVDRTQEVLSCEHVLMEAASAHEDILLPIFLALTYKEMCHQARTDRRSMIMVILKEGDNVPDVIRILNILCRIDGNLYFWITETNSRSGRKVKRKFGSAGSDLFVMAPTTSQPILIERFCGDNLKLAREEDVADAVDAFTREWERLEEERMLKREQEIALQKAIDTDKKKLTLGANTSTTDQDKAQVSETQSQTGKEIKESSKQIREARQARVTDTSEKGEKITIVLRHSNGKEERQFNKGAFFQEVYDWAGSNESLPLHFSIQRGREVVRHGDVLERTEVLHIYERDEAEIKSLLGSKVTFKGNLPESQSDGELSTTLPDENPNTRNKNEESLPGTSGIVLAQAEERQEVEESQVGIDEEENEEEEEKKEHREEEKKKEHSEEEEKEHSKLERKKKRKKKDKRTTAKRKKAKVENYPES